MVMQYGVTELNRHLIYLKVYQ